MSWYDYQNRDEQRIQVQRRIQQRRKNGEPLDPIVVPAGSRTKLSSTFWGQAWCRHLESFSDYDNRLPRGRTYLRQGSVLDLVISEGTVTATVAGSCLYDTRITITPMPKPDWKRLVKHCSGNVGSMLDLLAGKLGDDTLRLLTDRQNGMFPRPRQMRFSCTCPDWADMCKHVAAVLYGVGVRLDDDPGLLFVLRGVDSTEMLGAASADSIRGLDEAASGGELGDADLSALFGIDIGNDAADHSPEYSPVTPPAKPRRTAAKKKKAPAKKAAAKTAPSGKAARKKTAAGKKMVARKAQPTNRHRKP